MTDSLLNVAVVGAGAFGRNHLRVYRDLQQRDRPVRLAAIVEPEPSGTAALAEEWAVPIYASVDACLEARSCGEIQLDAASVCVPTSAHHAVASPLLVAGVDLLIEKPIAADTTQAADLLALAQKHNRILAIGHLERFNPAVTAHSALAESPHVLRSP